PPSSRNPPKVSAYALSTHWRSPCAKCRSSWIDGSATLTMETSRMTMKYAEQRRASAHQRLGSGTDRAATAAAIRAVLRSDAGVRSLRARFRRTADHRAGRRRPFGGARLLDRRRVARRARNEGGRVPLHRAPALQGDARVRRAADRGDLRRDGWRAERGHLA